MATISRNERSNRENTASCCMKKVELKLFFFFSVHWHQIICHVINIFPNKLFIMQCSLLYFYISWYRDKLKGYNTSLLNQNSTLGTRKLVKEHYHCFEISRVLTPDKQHHDIVSGYLFTHIFPQRRNLMPYRKARHYLITWI